MDLLEGRAWLVEVGARLWTWKVIPLLILSGNL